MAPKRHLKLSMENSLGELQRLSEALHTLLAEHSIPPETLYAADVTIEELVTNVIKYAYDDQAKHTIRVSIEVSPQDVRILIEDDGKEFDPLQAPEPNTSLRIEERPIGGLGIHLVRNLAESVTYTRVDGKNRIEVRLARHAGQTPSD